MPIYEYTCDKCNNMIEEIHESSKRPRFKCDLCGGAMHRVFSTFGINHGKTNTLRQIKDRSHRYADMEQDLRENHGIEKVNPINGRTFVETYKDVKQNQSAIADKFAERGEKTKKERAEKGKKWREAALKRLPERRKELKRKRG